MDKSVLLVNITRNCTYMKTGSKISHIFEPRKNCREIWGTYLNELLSGSKQKVIHW